jgi:hypothetical protein
VGTPTARLIRAVGVPKLPNQLSGCPSMLRKGQGIRGGRWPGVGSNGGLHAELRVAAAWDSPQSTLCGPSYASPSRARSPVGLGTS